MDKQAAKDAAAADLRRMLAEAKAELMANRAKRDTLVQQKANAVQQTVNKFLSSGSASSAAPSAGGLFGTASQPQTTQPSTGSGLFGAASSAAPSTGGLFGNAAATPQPAAGTTQQSTGSGLFGSLNPNANTQNAQAAQAGGQLFGNAPSNAAQPQQQTGLFGSSTANNTQPQQQQQQQQTTGLFGASTQTAQPAQNTSAFGSSILGGGNQQNSNAL